MELLRTGVLPAGNSNEVPVGKKKLYDPAIRLAKGALIGTGFILPGVSGGALAAIFGLYEKIINFLAHPFKDFRKNVLYFLPVAVGMLLGIVLLAYPLEFFLTAFPAQTMWCFIGCILGTFPLLWQQSGKKGRKPVHMGVLAVAFLIGLVGLKLVENLFQGDVPQNIGTWFLAGVIIALGVLVPGLSPSNFLLYMGMYAALVTAFKTLNLLVLLPVAVGGLVCMLALSKLFDWVFSRAHAGMFHFILGIVLASTVMIIPLNYNYISIGGLGCVFTCAGGVAVGLWMSRLEQKYKPEE